MVDPALTAEFPWLRTDPTPILGDARPRTTAELLEKPRIWLSLYREWMASAHPDQLAILDRITRSETSLVEDAARLEPCYPNFYKAAGQMKDAARSDPARVRQRFPWAPADPKALLGEARPKDVASLVADGTSSPWAKVFDAWLTANPPFEAADQLFRRVMTGTRSDQARLDPSVAGFAHVMGKLKDRLREKHGSTAQRVMERAVDTLIDAGEQTGLTRGLGTVRTARTTTSAGPQSGASQGSTAAGRSGMSRTTQQGAAQRGQTGQRGPTTPQPARQVAPARSPAWQHVRKQVEVAQPLLQSVPQAVSWIGWLADRLNGFGGTIAEEATNLQAFKAQIETDSTWFAENITAVADQLGGASDDALFTALCGMRSAIYRLAWDIDLGYEQYYGGWPHQRIGYVIQGLAGAASPQLRFDAWRILAPLITDVGGFYDVVLDMLPTMLLVVQMRPPGFDLEDGAEPWSVPEIMRAKAELDGLGQTVAGWAAEQPAAEEDEATLDQVAQQTFGVPYQNLLQLAG